MDIKYKIRLNYKIIYFLLFYTLSVFALDKNDNQILLSESFLFNLNNINENKTVLNYGKIEGYVTVPNGIDPTTVVVQVAGIKQFNNTNNDFFTIPDNQGRFVFDNTFPVGSSVILLFWDKRGLLNRQTIPVYVSKNSTKLNVVLGSNAYLIALSNAFGVTQDSSQTGICGKIVGISSVELFGSEVELVDNESGFRFNANYFDDNNLPTLSQNYLSENGDFCFFNVESSKNSGLFSLKLKMNSGVIKSFFVNLPPYTFIQHKEFDASSELFQKVEFYTFDNRDKFYSFQTRHSNWHLWENLLFTTSSDYSMVLYHKTNAIYFPLGEDFFNLEYKLDKNEKHKFYIFNSTKSLIENNSSYKNEILGKIFNSKNSLKFKIMDKNQINVYELSLIQPIFESKVGSVFLNFNLEKFNIDKRQIKFYLRDIYGNSISQFIELHAHENSNEINGVFYNLPSGLFQLYVSVSEQESKCDNCTTIFGNEKLLWTSIVESKINGTQILSNDLQEINSFKIQKIKNENAKISVEIIPSGKLVSEQNSNLKLMSYVEEIKNESLFYLFDNNKLCYLPEVQKNLEMLGLIKKSILFNNSIIIEPVHVLKVNQDVHRHVISLLKQGVYLKNVPINLISLTNRSNFNDKKLHFLGFMPKNGYEKINVFNSINYNKPTCYRSG